MPEDLDWKKLKNFKCPQCGKRLIREGFIFCNCGFKIYQKRFDEIVTSLYKKNRRKDRENLAAIKKHG